MTSTYPTTRPRATLGALGGALWALSFTAWLITDIRELDPGSASFLAALVTYAVLIVVAPALVVVGHTVLTAALPGRLTTTGAVLAGAGLSAFAIGNAVELVSLAATGDTSVAGYVVSYVGRLVAFVGSLLVGIALIRRGGDPVVRASGWLQALSLPLGIGIGLLFAVVLPENEAGFTAAVSIPTGIAWLLLGRWLARHGAPVERTATPAPVR